MINQASQGLKMTLGDRIGLMAIVRGIIVSYVITLPIFIVFAFILTYTNFPERLISPVVAITTIISTITAGSTATRNLKNRGWLNGGIVGLIYMFVLYLLSGMIFSNFSIDTHVITMILIGLLAGAIGGIIGINFRRSTRLKIKR